MIEAGENEGMTSGRKKKIESTINCHMHPTATQYTACAHTLLYALQQCFVVLRSEIMYDRRVKEKKKKHIYNSASTFHMDVVARKA